MHRNPKTIATELSDKISGANLRGLPINVREGLDLAAEFMAATAAALVDAGLINDPDAAPAEAGQPSA